MKRVELPAPGVHFDERFAARLERLVVRVRASGERREGQGRGVGLGAGLEFVGYRPYRRGEDLRQLDWDLYARLDRPYVRLTRAESSERWVVLLDASASMGVGTPGKLQAAAEMALGIAAAAVRGKATCELRVFPGGRRIVARRQADVWTCMRALGELRAGGAFEGFERAGVDLRGVRRLFVVGDGIGAEPADLVQLFGRGRGLAFLQLLAPLELQPREHGAWRFVDAEGAGEHAVALTPDRALAYQRELESWLSGWRTLCARHRVFHGVYSSVTPFEEVLFELFG